MPVTVQELSSQDTNYIGKHNGNYAAIVALLNSLEQQIIGVSSASVNLTNSLNALFGDAVAVIGTGSYQPSGAGAILTVAAGYAWLPSSQEVVRKLGSTQIDFTGVGPGTYYIVVDSLGEPSRSGVSTGALYSVAWDGAAFGAITRIAEIAWGHDSFIAALVSAALGQTFIDLDARLEAAEAAQTASLAKTLADTDIELTAAEWMGQVALVLSGTLTANVTVTVPALKKPALLFNNTTGEFTVTVKTFAGTGPSYGAGDKALIYCDGADVIEILAQHAADTNPYIAASYVPGKPGAGATALYMPVPLAVSFPAGLAGSQAKAKTAATAQAVYSVRKNGVEFGTITFAAASAVGAFASASGAMFAAGDVLEIIAPSVQDATLADVGITLYGMR